MGPAADLPLAALSIERARLFSHPIPMLPDAALTLGLAAGTNMFAYWQRPREPGLDERSAQRIVGIDR
jgi:hypothetical protein